ncbi:MAG TPA: carbon-nitrogen hydrolase family protein [Planctomycetota bacterium]|nr:carbon-nitrogen hydrolase family protein [Planctomycetota bacterium]
MKLRIALVQLSAGADRDRNVAHACERVDAAARDGADFVLLPEVFSFVADASLWEEAAETVPGPTTERLAEVARTRRVHVLGGSILETCDRPGRCANTSFLLAPDGTMLATYRKMHLFKVTLPDGVVFDEIDYTEPGEAPTVVQTSFGRVGLTLCYDLRFPELYRVLTFAGASLMTVPSAFTAFTGEAHWKVLLRARAVENQVFMLAPNQVGTSVTGVRFHGHSLVVDPWGTVLAEGGEDEETVTVEIDTDRVDEVRRRLGALDHVRDDLLRRLAQERPK